LESDQRGTPKNLHF